MLEYTPKTLHFKVAIYFTLCCGVWPLFLAENKFYKKCYYAFSWLTYLISALCSFFYLVGLYNSVLKDLDIELAGSTATFSMVYIMGLIRVHYIWKDSSINLIKKIIKREQQIYESQDADIKKVYENNVRITHKINYYFWVSLMIDSVAYLAVVYPFYNTNPTNYDPVSHKTVVVQKIPYHTLSIFNPYNHFREARAVEELLCLVGALINYGSDVFFHTLMAYILGQFKIIQHILKNFDRYRNHIKEQTDCDQENSDIVTLKLCIIEHQKLLRFIDKFNNTTRYMMLMDFLQSSVQVGVLIIYVMKESNVIAIVTACGYSITMIYRLGIYYWYASEITEESYNIGKYAYGINWCDKSLQLKILLSILLMRCTRETGLQIGNLTIMSWKIYIGILKGAYSFVTFVLHV